MSRISEKNFQKIAEGALSVLFEKYPSPQSTRAVAAELCRDNEFAGKIMRFLHEKRLVVQIKNSRTGGAYEKWELWQLSPEVYKKYSERANSF
ncbi:MAG: hypothetical protein WC792_05895 [Candidatus Micrarchaeia archaeon]|jgi:hypothetical protein